ncbi:unnamed protein product [Eruca vesicaria subsp. sativa]|uniref:DNA/RNA-binding protein Alba-like domain-containing protein n=1 Tax=Eruca vesicaria subsp. sativa TaxID=29727 RepID=A0ABC8K9W4_ERUVS|nr:unnamed protein product [Eruca vesicaria subsp. sativa]
MERYNRVEKPRLATAINENEIRITSVGLIKNYISYATTLLQEKGVKDIVLKAMGQAISKTVTISEILKSKIPGLHQDVTISSMSITDVFEPTEEGLLPVELTRYVSMISITLSLSELNIEYPGYQAPAQIDQLKPQLKPQQGRQTRLPYNAYVEDSYGHGRRGRGRGRGRSGYGNYQGAYQGKYQGNYQEDIQENKGGYSDWGKGRGRGRSYGYRGDGYHGGRGGFGGGRDDVFGGGRDEGYGGRRGGFRGDKYGGGRDDGYNRGQGGYGYGGGRGYIRGRGRMGNGGRSRGGASYQNQA